MIKKTKDGHTKDNENLRPGDLLDCVNRQKDPFNCLENEVCKDCKFHQTILEAISSEKPCENQITINHPNDNTSFYNIYVNPFELDGELFLSVSYRDITHKQKKQFMESTYFHDLINLAGCLTGYLDVLISLPEKEMHGHLPSIKAIADQMLDEIIAQRELIKAEQNTLEINVTSFELKDLIADLKDRLQYNPAFKNCKLTIQENPKDLILETDRDLLLRILINMLKNAAEASTKDETITLNIDLINKKVRFNVHNLKPILPINQKSIFKFGFSTKGKGRGVGTYSIRLLGENLLKGSVNFSSTIEDGTTFTLLIPQLQETLTN